MIGGSDMEEGAIIMYYTCMPKCLLVYLSFFLRLFIVLTKYYIWHYIPEDSTLHN
jgi:hypothetical protein